MTTALRPSAADIRRRELAAFLRSRRERITPEQLGLPIAGRRRTPGLRREEVAQLAGVGVTWYTWLEQGRDINASEQVLQAVASTLRLDPYERAHLFTLAGMPEPVAEKECKAVTPEIHAMLDKLEPYPAAVYNARTDILAYNRTYDWLMDIDRLPFEERNSMLQCFTNPEWRARLVDWADNVPRTVAELRAMMAEHVSEPAWKHLVRRLRRESPEFEALWRKHDVRPMRNLAKRIRHPEAGLMSFNFTHMWFGRHSETRMTTYVPADEETERKLRLHRS